MRVCLQEISISQFAAFWSDGNKTKCLCTDGQLPCEYCKYLDLQGVSKVCVCVLKCWSDLMKWWYVASLDILMWKPKPKIETSWMVSIWKGLFNRGFAFVCVAVSDSSCGFVTDCVTKFNRWTIFPSGAYLSTRCITFHKWKAQKQTSSKTYIYISMFVLVWIYFCCVLALSSFRKKRQIS